MGVKRGVFITLLLFIFNSGNLFPVPDTSLGIPAGEVNDRATVTAKIEQLQSFLSSGRMTEAKTVFDWLNSLTLAEIEYDTLLFSDIDYYCGTYLLMTNRHDMANQRFQRSISLKESIRFKDLVYFKAFSNLGVSLYRKGDFRTALSVYDNLLKTARMHPVGFDAEELTYFINMSASCIRLQDYDRARSLAERGIEIADSLAGKSYIEDVVLLNHNLGITYSRRNDYTSALLYLNRAWQVIKDNPKTEINIKISLINTLTVIHTKQGNHEKARRIYEDAYPLAIRSTRDDAFYFVNNYASFLARNNQSDEVISLTKSEIGRLALAHGDTSRLYHEVLSRYGKLYGQYEIKSEEVLSLIEKESIPYCNKNSDDHYLISDVYEAYALCLMRAGRNDESLIAIQTALFPESMGNPPKLSDPDPKTIKPDREGLEILQSKISILRSLYAKTGDTVNLIRAVATNKLLISSVEKVRIDIGEEESRILLGDNFMEVYDGIISDLYKLYSLGGKEEYFEMAFEFAERSKAAGLLVSLREVKATEFNIPDSLVLAERSIESELGHTRELLSIENSRPVPDTGFVRILTDNELRLSEAKRRLTSLFEEKYPEFYAAKYNTSVASIDDVLKIAGRKGNYINYIFADSEIYTFIINKKFKKIIALKTDSSLNNYITDFRKLLQYPVIAGGTRAAFNSYVSLGNNLYKMLFEPAERYLISDKIIISPDDMLTYIPFETLLKNSDQREDLLYRELDFLIRDYDISYTYSATMSVETGRDDRSILNRAIAFAPEYNSMLNRQSILNSRQGNSDTLVDLPFARNEAQYVVSRVGGELYLRSEATENIYKSRVSSFSIVHLAMHTIIDEDSPGYSKLIFSAPEGGDAEEGFLNTYEIYNVPLSAKMVVLSSCNTGSGKLRSGEGVMSLARGFINAGSHSVVMSLWEVNDEMGTEVVKEFYNNLLKGQRKSEALRKAKLKFIDSDESSQFRGNPFYW